MMSAPLKKIQILLKQRSTPGAEEAYHKFIPGSQKVIGVRMPELNKIANEFKSEGFPLVEALWVSGVFEEQMLAVKILGKVCRKDAAKTMDLLKEFSGSVNDWAICDTLGTQGVRNILKHKEVEIFSLAEKFLKDEYVWKRRLGIVLLLNFARFKHHKENIRKLIEPLRSDKEHYIKKAIVWIDKDLTNKSI